MKNVFLETENVRQFQTALAVLEDVEMGQPGLGVVWGRAGRGKTVCAREYAIRTDAVYLRVLEDWSPRAMLAELCRKLVGTEPRTVERCKIAACEALDHRTRTVLVDEADRLNVGQIEHFRDIHDLCGAPIVLIGEEHLFAQLSCRSRLWDRVTQRVEFGPVCSEDIMLFGMKAADLRIQADAAKILAARSGGTFRKVWVDVHHLEQMAKANRIQEIDAKMAEALPRWRVPSGAKRLNRAGKSNGNGSKGGSHG